MHLSILLSCLLEGGKNSSYPQTQESQGQDGGNKIRLWEFIGSRRILIDQRFGFRPAYSTTHQLVRVSQLITHEVNVNKHPDVILIDLTRAFDSVWHHALIFKLANYGFNLTKTS
ncbi:Probable RNA-directed DNA polymerase from transposon BS [Anthophora quadrimaculata]